MNFNNLGATFSQGDFNYDGAVNALDFNSIATGFGTTLPAPAAPLSMVLSPLRSSSGEKLLLDVFSGAAHTPDHFFSDMLV
jgi:hypothetical protein